MEASRQAQKVSTASPKSSKVRSPAITGTRLASASSTSQPLEGDANVGRSSTQSFVTTASTPSTYEPTLRFPTPFGNHDLAEWISSSDPDIKSSGNSQDTMRMNEELDVNSVAVDGAGLSESTYELISGNTDSESQDGTYAESLMTESMESLDLLSRDDAASEHIVDEEEVYDDEPTTIDTAERPDDEDDEVDETTVSEEATESAATLRPVLNFANQSLRTPTLGTPAATPEASKILPRDEPPVMPGLGRLESWVHQLFRVYDKMQYRVDQLLDNKRSRVAASEEVDHPLWNPEESKRRAERQQAMIYASNQPDRHRLVKRVALSVKYFLLILVGIIPGLLLSSVWFFPFWARQAPEPPRSNLIPLATTTRVTSISSHVAATTTSNVKALAPPEQEPGEMWFNKIMNPPPDVTFSSEGDDCVVVEVKPTIPKYWLGEDCIGIDSARNGDMVPNQWTATKHDTIKVKFPSPEAYGLIEVKLKADCRPRFERAVKVRFSKRGVLEKAVDRAKNLTQEVKALIVVAQEEAKHNLCAVQSSWQDLGVLPAQIRDRTRILDKEGFIRWRQTLTQPLGSVVGDIAKVQNIFNLSAWQNVRDQVTKDLPVQRAEMVLLDYQIPAKVWWLRLTAGQAAADEYKTKAKVYTEQKEKELAKGK